VSDKKKRIIELISKRAALLERPPIPGSRNIERGIIQDAQRRVCSKKKLKNYLYIAEHNDPNTTDKPELELRKAIRDFISPGKKTGKAG